MTRRARHLARMRRRHHRQSWMDGLLLAAKLAPGNDTPFTITYRGGKWVVGVDMARGRDVTVWS